MAEENFEGRYSRMQQDKVSQRLFHKDIPKVYQTMKKCSDCDALRFTRIKNFKYFFVQKYKAELMENICGHGIVLGSSVRGISKATRANISVSGQKIFPDFAILSRLERVSGTNQ